MVAAKKRDNENMATVVCQSANTQPKDWESYSFHVARADVQALVSH